MKINLPADGTTSFSANVLLHGVAEPIVKGVILFRGPRQHELLRHVERVAVSIISRDATGQSLHLIAHSTMNEDARPVSTEPLWRRRAGARLIQTLKGKTTKRERKKKEENKADILAVQLNYTRTLVARAQRLEKGVRCYRMQSVNFDLFYQNVDQNA